MKKIIIIGGGAAGLMCAALASERGAKVTLIEKNEKLGKKLYITGKGRCNFTNDCTEDEFLENVLTNSRFLYSSIYGFSPKEVISTFEKWGLPHKTERGRRVFPASDRASDVTDALRRRLEKNNVNILLNTEAVEVLTENIIRDDSPGNERHGTYNDEKRREKKAGTGVPEKRAVGVTVKKPSGQRETYTADGVVIATGGLAYPSTGSTGDGYAFADKAGLKVTERYPSLVPMNCAENYISEMQGLSLKNVELHIKSGKKEVFDGFGEMMFTHFGITGPLVLSASAKIGPLIGKRKLTTWIDLKPAVDESQLDARILRIFASNPNRELKSVLGELYPAKMIPVMPRIFEIDPEKRIHDITREERRKIISATKHFPLTIVSLRPYNEAVVTKGGISVKEIDPRTMETKKVRGLYFIGEVLDVDAYTGGYNLQIAWSTAAACAGTLTSK